MQAILDYSIFGNTILDYLTSFAVLLSSALFVYVFKKYVLIHLNRWSESTETSLDDLLVRAISKGIPILYFGVFYLSLHTLNLTEKFESALNVSAIIVVTLLAVRALVSTFNFGLQSYLNKSPDSSGGERQLKGIRGLVNFAIWAIALVFMLDNLGIKISAVVAGLGIGGIAVALAAQAVLADLFSYFVIFFDKPFEVGDFIVVGDKMGAVEQIGIKTTRIRSLGGEQLVFSNTDLTNSRVHNFKKMEKRRVVFKLGVTYRTSSEKLRKINKIVKDAIETQNGTFFDRGHFAAYGDFSLNFEFVYYVTGADYAKYMDVQQAINLAIFEAFETEKIEFAYPTQTVFLNKN